MKRIIWTALAYMLGAGIAIILSVIVGLLIGLGIGLGIWFLTVASC